MSEHIFASNGGYCVYHPSNFFWNTRSFENWGISLRYSPISGVACMWFNQEWLSLSKYKHEA